MGFAIFCVGVSVGTLFGAWWATRGPDPHDDDPDDRYCN